MSGVSETGSHSLLRVLGLGFGIAVVVGATVGQGILRTPGIVAAALHNGPLILGMWLAGGLMSLVDSLSIAELAASLPGTGGPYVFVREAFGSFAGFLAGWTDWLAQTATASFIAIVFGECLHRLGFSAGLSTAAIGIALIAGLCVFHLLGTRTSGWSQHIGSAVKAAILLGIAAAFFTSRAAPPSMAELAPVGAIGFISAFRAIYATYGGWNGAAYFCEEVRDPGRSVPRAIFSGLVIVTILYTLVNAALLHVLPMDVFGASNLPVADGAALVLGANGALFVALTATIIVLTVQNTQLMFTPRILYGMARDDLMPPLMARVTTSGAPIGALLATGILAIALASSGVYERLLAIYAPLSTTTYALVNLAAIRMRHRYPELPRPFRMPLFPLPSLVALTINLTLTVAFVVSDFANARYALLLVASGAPVYWWRSRRSAASVA